MPGYGSGPYGTGPYGGTPPITGSSSNQGFVFQLSADAPCNFPYVMQQLAGQVEAKGVQLDSDVSRIAANNFVKVSRTNNPGNTAIVFDTVEVNRGTPTDLSLWNGLLLNPGRWLVGAAGTTQCTIPGANQMRISSASESMFPNPSSVRFSSQIYFEDAGGLSGGPLIWPQQRSGVAFVIAAPLPNWRIGANGGGGVTDVTAYFELWAYQIGDL